MANIDAPFGLRPIAKLGSAPGGTTALLNTLVGQAHFLQVTQSS